MRTPVVVPIAKAFWVLAKEGMRIASNSSAVVLGDLVFLAIEVEVLKILLLHSDRQGIINAVNQNDKELNKNNNSVRTSE